MDAPRRHKEITIHVGRCHGVIENVLGLPKDTTYQALSQYRAPMTKHVCNLYFHRVETHSQTRRQIAVYRTETSTQNKLTPRHCFWREHIDATVKDAHEKAIFTYYEKPVHSTLLLYRALIVFISQYKNLGFNIQVYRMRAEPVTGVATGLPQITHFYRQLKFGILWLP